MPGDIVGRVVGTEPAGPLDYHVSVAEGQYLQLDDLVVLTHDVPGVGPVHLYGMVTDVRAHHDGASGHYDVHHTADGTLPARAHALAGVLTTRVEPQVFAPPLPGSAVRRAVGEERFRALMLDGVADDRRLPAGIARTGGPMFIDADFLDGTNGAHVNISGVSGVATKTSYALFLLHMLLRPGSRVLGRHRVHARGVVFNVKGQDLLYLDQPNQRMDAEQRERWRELGVDDPGPFEHVALWAPPNPRLASPQPASERQEGVRAYFWSLAAFCAEGMLSLLFADADDERQQYAAVARIVESRLADERIVEALPGGGVRFVDRASAGQQATTFRELVAVVGDRVESDQAWYGAQSQGSVNAFMRRLWSSVDHVGHLLRGDTPTYDAHRPRVVQGDRQLNVIDINPLSGRAQRFVVGATLRQEFAAKEQRGARHPLLFVVLDELNKYAPRRGDSPIKATLTEIAERGRSLGIVLIGAQQTASQVDEAIVTNASIKVVGRLDAGESTKDEYRFLPHVHRQRATLLTPGAMVLSQPTLPAPVLIGFPLPGWATKREEAPAAGASADEVRASLSVPVADD